MNLIQILILAVIQGAAELLPVSSSAHVIMAEKLMGLDPTSPEMTFLLIMLHTGTMIAVLGYFWPQWKAIFKSTRQERISFIQSLGVATALTGIIGYALKFLIEKVFLRHQIHAEIEQIFGNLLLIATSLAGVGSLIIWAGSKGRTEAPEARLDQKRAGLIGAVQGLCMPFRGFSRSGATISTGLLLGIPRLQAEQFSFALAVVLTPPLIVREAHRLLRDRGLGHEVEILHSLRPGLLGMVFSFLAGWLALKWLSSWLERGKWSYFGYYCWAASLCVFLFYFST